MRRSGRNVVISGVSSGIGEALALECSRHRDVVIGLSRNRKKLERLEQRIRGQGGQCLMLFCDVSNESSVREAVRRGRKETGEFDVVINNAGVTAFKEFAKTSAAEFDEILATNLRGAFLLTKEILPAMIRRRKGLFVNIVSYAARTTYTGSAAYSAAKSGLEAMMNVVREEVREKNIRVMNIYPGAVLTPMWSRKHRQSLGDSMIPVEHFAKFVYDHTVHPPSMTVEEIVVRPPIGDLKV